MKLSPLRTQENLHVILWLVKDLSWLMEYKVLGLVMVFPTIAVAGIIAWQSRNERRELFHAIAVTLWICANSTWMIEDFFFNEQGHVIAQSLFLSGLAVLGVYYLAVLPRETRLARNTGATRMDA